MQVTYRRVHLGRIGVRINRRIPSKSEGKADKKRAELPYDILIVIFGYFRENDVDDLFIEPPDRVQPIRTVLSTCLVCRAWCEAAQTILYERLEPRSLQAALKLARTLSANPHLASLVRSIVPPNLWRDFGTEDVWQKKGKLKRKFSSTFAVLPIATVEFLLSKKEYEALMGLFVKMASMCTRIAELSVPLRVQLDGVGYHRNFQILDAQMKYIRTLSLQCLHLKEDLVSLQKMEFPEVTELTVDDIRLSILPEHFMEGFPRLHTLRLFSTINTGELAKVIAPVYNTLQRLQVSVVTFGRDFFEVPWPCFMMPSPDPRASPSPIPVLGNIIAMGFTAYNYLPSQTSSEYDLQPMPNMKHLTLYSLSKYDTPTWIEFKFPLPSLEDLTLYVGWYENISGMLVLMCHLFEWVKHRNEFAPKLQTINLICGVDRVLEYREVWKMLLFCLDRYCASCGIEVKSQLTLMRPPEAYASVKPLASAWCPPSFKQRIKSKFRL